MSEVGLEPTSLAALAPKASVFRTIGGRGETRHRQRRDPAFFHLINIGGGKLSIPYGTWS